MNEFITSMQLLWDRLAELAKIEIKTEAERYEEQIKSREFYSLIGLNSRLKNGSILFYNPNDCLTTIQRRIMHMARYQEVSES